jgi:ribose 5-phosphate isomerase A
MPDDRKPLKKIAAEKAVDYIKSGMLVGLGVGSTAIYAVDKIGELINSGSLTNITAIACSKATHDYATDLGIPLTFLDKKKLIDITIDGADEVDQKLNLIKGGGGALLREKIVAQSTIRQIIVVDDSKLSQHLGRNFSLPIEVLQFGYRSHFSFLKDIGGNPIQRINDTGKPYITDQGNFIIDSDFGAILEPQKLASKLDQRAGIIAHGLFLNLASEVIVASSSGINILKK